jgi:hypothetical protein
MSTWRPPWSAPGQFKLTLLPPTRASNSVTARPAPGPGSTAALRTGSRDPGTPRPARRSRLARRPTTSAPVGPSPSGHAQPAQPQPPPPAPHERRTRAGVTRPDATTPSRPAGMARPRSVCPAWVGEQSKHGCADAQWQTPRRRRRTDGARLRRHPNLRRGRLHRPALPVQPRSALRDPPRVGSAGGDSAAHPPARPRSWVTAQVAAGYRGPAGRGWIAGKKACATSRVEAPTAAATRGRLAARVKVAP